MNRMLLCCVVLSFVSLVASAAPPAVNEFTREEIEQAKKVEIARREKLFNKGRTNIRLIHTQKLLEGALSTLEQSEAGTHFDYDRVKKTVREALGEIERVKRLTARAQSELPPLP